MATLTGKTIAGSYKDLLKINANAYQSGVDGTLRAIEDGDATASALWLATDSALISGDGNRLYFYDADGDEHISADNAGVLSIAAGAEIDLTATAVDLNGTLDVSGNTQLSGTVTVSADGTGKDVIFYSGTVGDNFTWDASEECLIITGTDAAQSLKVADGDLVVVDKIYLYDNDGGEYISGDGTDFTLTSGSDIHLTATNDVNIPVNVGLRFGDGGENIETDNTDFTITSGGKLNLTATSDIHTANATGVVFGHTAQETISIGDGATDLVPEVQVLGTGQVDSSLMLASFSTTATAAGAPLIALVKGGNATIGSHTVVTDGEELGNIIAYGDDGTDLEAPAAMIQFEVDGTPGTGDMPGRMIFATTTDSGETLTERMRIDSAGDVTFTGDLIMADGKGIDFQNDASPASGMTAEILDDYETGTWDAVVSDGTNPMTMNGSADTGYYTKVGNLVTVSGYFITTSLGDPAASGAIRITGLPFAIANNNAAYSGGTAAYGHGLDITAGHSVSYSGEINATYIHLQVWDVATGISSMLASEWTADGRIMIGFSYRAA